MFHAETLSCKMFTYITYPSSSPSTPYRLTHLLECPYLNHLQPTGSFYMEHIQGLNLNRRSISRLEPEIPVTLALTSRIVIYTRYTL
jgi:hypothetical protein